MELKSLIEKIMYVNDALGYSDNTKKLIDREYLLKDDSQAFKELEKLLINSIKYSQSQELKLGLELILILISHKNEDVKSSALAKIFILMDDGLIQELVVKELKEMSNNENKDTNEFAEQSLNLIATEIHKFDVVDATFDIFSELKNKITFKMSQFKFPIISLTYKQNSAGVSKDSIFYNNSLFKGLSCKLRAITHRIDGMVPSLEEVENYNKEFREYKKTKYLDVQNSKSSEKESLQKLAEFYARTFTERGHLRRLTALLDDDDYDVQQIGVNALTEIVEILLGSSAEKRLIKPLDSNDLEKISPLQS